MSRNLKLEKKIDAYVRGKLSEEEARQLWKKLMHRPDYIELLNTELGLKAILDKKNSEQTSDSAKENSIIYTLRRSGKWLAAAAVAVLVVSISTFQTSTHDSLQRLVPKKFNLADNLASAEIMRSQKTSIHPSDSLLNRGFEAALSGDISRAIAAYNEVIKDYSSEPAATKAYLNKGIIQYNSASFGKSIASFQAVLDNGSQKTIMREKAYWYMGNAYINIEQLEKARKAIHKVYSMEGIYQKPSSRLLRKLDQKLGIEPGDYEEFEK